MHSLQSRTPLLEKENATSRLMLAKQTGLNSSSKCHSTLKKKTLVDVSNTVRAAAVQSGSKQVFNTDLLKAKQGLKVFQDKENLPSIKRSSQLKATHTLKAISTDESHNDKSVMPVCACENNADELPDFMFKDLKMSKKTIDDLALIWENPIFTSADIRDISISPLKSPVLPETTFLTQFCLNEEDLKVDVPYVEDE